MPTDDDGRPRTGSADELPGARGAVVPLPTAVADGHGPSGLRLLRSSEALANGDQVQALMAQALVTLMRVVPGSLGLFGTVDRRLSKFASGVLVVHGRDPGAAPLEAWLTRYRQRYHLVDPFAPRRFARSSVGVIDQAELSDERPLERSQYVREFLGALELSAQTSLLLRADGRIVAAVDLLRTHDDGPITAYQLSLLRSGHAFLEQAYACALGLPAQPQEAGAILSAGLTRREMDVVRLIAAGASNAEIASALAISEATVKSHLMRVFEKLNVRSRTQVALLVSAERPFAESGLPPAIGLGSAEH